MSASGYAPHASMPAVYCHQALGYRGALSPAPPDGRAHDGRSTSEALTDDHHDHGVSLEGPVPRGVALDPEVGEEIVRLQLVHLVAREGLEHLRRRNARAWGPPRRS